MTDKPAVPEKAQAPLSERLDAEIRSITGATRSREIAWDLLLQILRESADMARRVETAPVAGIKVAGATPAEVIDSAKAIASVFGKRVALVPVEVPNV